MKFKPTILLVSLILTFSVLLYLMYFTYVVYYPFKFEVTAVNDSTVSYRITNPELTALNGYQGEWHDYKANKPEIGSTMHSLSSMYVAYGNGDQNEAVLLRALTRITIGIGWLILLGPVLYICNSVIRKRKICANDIYLK